MHMAQGQRGPEVHNNIILNLNGPTNINNFNHAGPQSSGQANGQMQHQQMKHIQGRRLDGMPGPHLRISQEGFDAQNESNSMQTKQPNQQQLSLLAQQQKQYGKNKTAATLLPKKLLNQAKSAKNARITPKGIMQKSAKAAAASGLNSGKHQLHETQNMKTYQTQTSKVQKSKANSQFDFNFNNLQQQKQQKDKNTTIDYPKQGSNDLNSTDHNNGSSQNVSKIQNAANQTSRRQVSNSFNNLQSVMNQKPRMTQQLQSHKNPKSSRSMAQSKQATSFTKHKRHKSEVKKHYQYSSRPVTKINTLLKQANHQTIQKQHQNGDAKLQSFEHNKENLHGYNLSGERNSIQNQTAPTNNPSRIAAQTVTNKSKNQEGLSISSFSSGSNRGKYNPDLKNQKIQNNRTQAGSLADQLTKNYFLNSKQLLKHLSPNRVDTQIEKSQQKDQNVTALHMSGLNSNLSQRNRFRGRTRSTAVAPSTQVPKATHQRKTHSQSQSRSNNNQQLQTLRNQQQPQLQSIIVNSNSNKNPQPVQSVTSQNIESRVMKSKSANFAQPNSAKDKYQQPSKTQINKQAVDKLIKQNIRKKKSQLDEECVKKQIEQQKQRQRRAELTQRNQEVRMINASKIINQGNTLNQPIDELYSPQENPKQNSANDTSQRRRSQSCIDYSNKKGATATSAGSRRAHHSQENKKSNQGSQPPVQQYPPRPAKIIPNTVTNRGKPRSFVHEINQLTYLIEKEIGVDQSRQEIGGLNSNRITQQNYQQKSAGPLKSAQNKRLNQTAIEGQADTTMLSAYQQFIQSNGSGQFKDQPKKPKKGERPSFEIQKFIERKKREELVKKSLEMTIEVDKHNKIQQNLVSLDKVRKKNLRQRSQPAIASKKNSTANTKTNIVKNQKQKNKKSKNAQDQPIIGLSQIFYQKYQNTGKQVEKPSSFDLEQTPNNNRYEIKFEMAANQNLESVKIANLKQQKRNSMNSSMMGDTDLLTKPRKSRSNKGNKASNGKKISAPGTGKHPKSKKNIGSGMLDKTLPSTANHFADSMSNQINQRKTETVGRPQFGKHQSQDSSLINLQHIQSRKAQQMKMKHQVPSNSRDTSQQPRAQMPNHINQQRPAWLAQKHPVNMQEVNMQEAINNVDDMVNQEMEYQQSSRRQSASGVPIQPNMYAMQQRPESKSKVSKKSKSEQQSHHQQRITPSSFYATDLGTSQEMIKSDQNSKLSPKSTEQIRRIHELVALYRCRFKTGISDAAIMGNLHSAASVIQINFRYLRHLREAGLKKPSQDLKQSYSENINIEEDSGPIDDQMANNSGFIDSEAQSNQFNQFNQLQDLGKINLSGISREVENVQVIDSQSDYIDTTEKRNYDRDSKNEKSQEKEIINTSEGDDWYGGNNGEPYYADFNQTGQNIEVISDQMFQDAKTTQNILELARGSAETQQKASVFTASVHINSNENSSRERSSSPQHNSNNDKNLKQDSQEFHMIVPSKVNKPKNKSESNNIKQKTNKSYEQLTLDVDGIEEEWANQMQNQQHQQPETNAKSSLAIDNQNSQHSGKGQKTPQVPGLDLRQVGQGYNTKNKQAAAAANMAQNVVKVEKQQTQDSMISKGKESPRSQSANNENPQTASSYSGIFNRLGLPLPRSARVVVDYALVKKDPRMVQQLKEIVDFKEQRGRQVMDEGRRDNFITERTYEINRIKLEKWVGTSYNKIDENQLLRSSRPQKIQTQEELIQANVDGRAIIQKILNVGEAERVSARSGFPSARNQSLLSQSGRGNQLGYNNQGHQNQYPSERGAQFSNGDNYTDRDPYGNNINNGIGHMQIGSGRNAQRSELVHMINGDSSSSSKPKREQSGSDSRKNQPDSSSYRARNAHEEEDIELDEIQLQIDDPKNRMGRYRIEQDRALLNPNNSAEDRFENEQFETVEYQNPNNIKNQNFIDEMNDEQIQNIMRAQGTLGPKEDVSQHIDDSQQSPLEHYMDRESSQHHQKTEKSLNRSQSYHTMPPDLGPDAIDNLNQNSERDEIVEIGMNGRQATENSPILDHDAIDIELQLETALTKEKNKLGSGSPSGDMTSLKDRQKTLVSPQAQLLSQNTVSSDGNPTNINAIRDPKFFTSRVEDDNDLMRPSSMNNELNINIGNQDLQSQDQELKDELMGIKSDITSNDDDQTKGQTTNFSNTILESANKDLDKLPLTINDSYLDNSTRSPQTTQKLIKVENQQFDDNQLEESDISQFKQSDRNVGRDADKLGGRVILTVETLEDNNTPGHPVSPVSDQQLGAIQTGAHSLSSTGSDMAAAIHAVNRDHREHLDSPPDLISPVSANKQIIELIPKSEHNPNAELADMMTDYLFAQILAELQDDVEIMVPRPQIANRQKQGGIKFFEKKGIKTDLFAIEKYVDEVLEEVKMTRIEFMTEIERPLSKNAAAALFQMQNSEIGTYEHFSQTLPPVLSLDLYLKLEKRRKESREHADPVTSPDGRFDFEKVNDEELKEDGVDKNFLAECQHIHNKVLFDSINDSLQQFRPHGKEGAPMLWSRLNRKLKPTEDFTLEEMFEITKHDLFRMAIMQAGTLPRREFVFHGHFDEDLFAEIREKKLATLLCREIVENEPQWLKWDFEEAQTKIDIADMVLESLVTETIQFLQIKTNEKSEAQIKFEEIQESLKSKS